MSLVSALQIIAVSAVAVSVALGLAFAARPRMERYWERSCTGRAWVNQFPAAGSKEFRKFLYVFVDSFGFPRRRALQFSPSDQILDVYRSLYPSKNVPDALEVETFARSIKATYGLSLGDIWHKEITLGEVFAQASAAA